MIYRCYFLDASDRIQEREHFHAENEAAALEQARQFLSARGYAAAELWVGGTLVARVTADRSGRHGR